MAFNWSALSDPLLSSPEMKAHGSASSMPTAPELVRSVTSKTSSPLSALAHLNSDCTRILSGAAWSHGQDGPYDRI